MIAEEGHDVPPQPLTQILLLLFAALCGATLAYLFARLGKRQDRRQEWYDELEARVQALETSMERRVLKLEWKLESWDGLAAQHAGELLKPPAPRRR